MRAFIWKVVDRLGRSYWFIPLCMALAAVCASIGMIAVDRVVGTVWFHEVWWLYVNQPSAARALLQVIAGSMITVAGVTFSITIATVANASSQFGPRLMTNFMNDRGNQITLGTFVATFLYCLLVLRTVRGGDGVDGADVFVPHLSILGGLLLAVASLGVLIYFVHHVPETIHISHVIARVGRQLDHRIDALYASRIGHGESEGDGPGLEEPATSFPIEDVATVNADTVGYIQHIETVKLMQVAQTHGLVLWVVRRPGDFATRQNALVLAKPAAIMSEKVAGQIQGAFVIGSRRTPSQDVLFLVNQLVEVAARALSPGTNDPFTAIYCINWLVAALGKLAGREAPEARRRDDAGELRLVVAPVDFKSFADAIFGQLRPYVQTDRNAALHTLSAMVDLIAWLPEGGPREVVLSHCEALRRGCETEFSHPADREAVESVLAGAVALKGVRLEGVMVAESGDHQALYGRTAAVGGTPSSDAGPT